MTPVIAIGGPVGGFPVVISDDRLIFQVEKYDIVRTSDGLRRTIGQTGTYERLLNTDPPVFLWLGWDT